MLSLALNTLDMAWMAWILILGLRFILLRCIFDTVDSGRDKGLWRAMVQAANHRRVCVEICQPIISDSCCLAKRGAKNRWLFV